MISFVIIIAALLAAFLFITNKKNIVNKENQAIHSRIETIKRELLKNNKILLEDRLTSNFTKEQLIKIAQKYLNYSLAINGQYIEEKDTFYSDSPNITITLKEECDKNATDILPESIMNYGSLINQEDAEKLIKISSVTKSLPLVFDTSEYKRQLTYRFSKVKPGEIITLEIDPVLAEKLNLTNNIIEIFYNKAK